MLEIILLLCLFAGASLLILLSIIDLRTYLLPNIYVGPFAILGVIFHAVSGFYYLDLSQVVLGGLTGFLVLYIIRAAGNHYYGQDSLGLGDVKLLGAGGLWLGVEGILFSMTLGALAGLIHGVLYATYLRIKKNKPFSLTRLTIPAGPGFTIGIIIVGVWMYKGLVLSTFYSLTF